MQRDLFSSVSQEASQTAMSDFNQGPALDSKSKISTYGLDKLLIGVCLLVISYVVVFSWGVERGRKQVRMETEVKVEKLHNELSRLTLVARELVRTPLPRIETPPAPVQAVGTAEVQSVSLIQDRDYSKAASSPAPSAVSDETAGEVTVKGVLIGKKQFTVQLATYLTAVRAEEQIEKLKKIGYDAFVIPSGKYFQVCIEKLPKKSMAETIMNKVKNESSLYRDAYIRNVPV
ncbi:MAG: hypothetical protein HY587_04115 [Candidatus Omnitrophica bacterium]|nr:hypothetical protein [Candidatus Omnitrophota bacterium]